MKDVRIASPMVDEMLKLLDERYQNLANRIAKWAEKGRDYSPTSRVMMIEEREVLETIDRYHGDRETFACLINRIFSVPHEHHFRICSDETGKHYIQCVDLSQPKHTD